MPDTADPSQFVKPFVYETLGTKALHFSICEIQSRMQIQRPHALDLDYTRTMMAFLLFVPPPGLMGMIGLGGGSLAKFCHHYLPDTRIKVVEINPHVIALREQFKVPPDDERLQVRRGDGADFVRDTRDRLDVLLVDGFDHDGQPPELCSQAFYDDCRAALRADGMLVVNLHTAHPEFALHVARIERAFDGDALFVGDGECSNTIAFAGKGLGAGQPRPGVLRKPRPLDRQAWHELMPAFGRVAGAARQQHEDA
ncbi:transferase [Roseateles saccharophilus]|uniref:Spermidine synthase n=1 Tax=Roseateles saccharophilus TaxID=304 RepID=A0A4R3VCE2_ROSSA|nr:transferase [Roseateles saccharophilus]MDG0831714.1 transferase [Roseateles saccharophilus]TCV01268.1 spermidine synthase [Roseateles saccharophilus]